jgi:hypothetical protein
MRGNRMKKKSYKLKSKIIKYPGMDGWYFLLVSKKESELIRETYGKQAKGWGSLPVSATLGKTRWNTSIFPDKKSGTYILPLKAAVRRAEDILSNDTVSFSISLRV